MEWNVLLTVVPGVQHTHTLIGALCNLGEFHRTRFNDVCIGRVADVDAFLGSIAAAKNAAKVWATYLGRVVPVDTYFTFTPENLVAKLRAAVDRYVERLTDGTFHVRLERRGYESVVSTPEVERIIAEHLIEQVGIHGRLLRTDFKNPHFIVAIETLGDECGVGLITRERRSLYPFVQTR